jgi:hypothetical protein
MGATLMIDNRMLIIGSFEESDHGLTAEVKYKTLKIYTRDCLKCEKEFRAMGIFNRVCKDCHLSPIYRGASEMLDFCP